MSESQPTSADKSFFSRFTSEAVLGTLIVLLSVFTALASYQGALADSAEGDNNVEAQKILAESNTEFLRVNQDIIQDYTMYDGYYINQGVDDFAAEYYNANFSPELQASLERTEGPFDEAYYDAMYEAADSTYVDALTKFDAAQAAGDQANKYQLVMLVMAVGLSFAAWGSLLDEQSKMRLIFTLLAAVAFVAGLGNYLTI